MDNRKVRYAKMKAYDMCFHRPTIKVRWADKVTDKVILRRILVKRKAYGRASLSVKEPDITIARYLEW